MHDLLTEHFEELDFLWEQRERSVFAADWTVRTLVAIEERAEAHLDGLRLGGARALVLARPFLAGEETGAATAAAFTFLASNEPRSTREVLDACAVASPAALDGLRVALRHTRAAPIEEILHAMGVGAEARLRALAADVLAFQRLRPPPELERLYQHEDAGVRALALGAAGRAGRVLGPQHVRQGLDDPDARVRLAALHAAAHAGIVEVAALCRERVRRFQPAAETVQFLGVVGEPDDLPVLEQALREPDLAPAALQAMADLGMPELLPAVLGALETPELGPAAAAAFTQITGIDVPRAPAPPAVSDDDPPPDAARAAAEWNRIRDRFGRGRRNQHGRDVDAQPLREALDELPLRSRRLVYLRHRLRHPGATPDLELEARVYRPPAPRRG